MNVAANVVPVNENELLAEEEQAQWEAKWLKQVLNDVQCKHNNLVVKCQEAWKKHEAEEVCKAKEVQDACKEREQAWVASKSLQKVQMKLGVS